MQYVLAAFCLGLALAGTAPAAAQETSVAKQILFEAVQSDDVELADFALSKGARVDGRDARGLTPLLIAALFDSRGALELLLERGADTAAARKEDGLTALHLAAYKGHHRLIRPLIAAGAPVAARTAVHGKTPLHLAARWTRRAAVAALIEGGAPLEARDGRRGNTPLIEAAFGPDNLAVIAELLAAGATIDAAAKDGTTALHAAGRRGQRDIVQLLLSEGAEVAAVD